MKLPQESKNMTTELKIGGMSCGHCARAVGDSLRNIEGVKTANVILEEGRATVETQGDVPVERLIAAVQEEGYEASLA